MGKMKELAIQEMEANENIPLNTVVIFNNDDVKDCGQLITQFKWNNDYSLLEAEVYTSAGNNIVIEYNQILF